MILHKLIIGIKFNKKMFRLSSLGGQAIDELINTCDKEKILNTSYFTKIATPYTAENEYTISLLNNDGTHSLSILPDQFVFKKSSVNTQSAVSIEKSIDEFKALWKSANSIIKFPETRRIGLVGQHLIPESKKDFAAQDLFVRATKLPQENHCNRFKLRFEERSLNSNGTSLDPHTDDFWNEIYDLYTSKEDEIPLDGYIYANLDIQKYYNPAKADPIREIPLVLERYKSKKTTLISTLSQLELVRK